MKIYIWGKHRWKCENAEQFFNHILHDTLIRAFVDTKPLLFNRFFGAGNWESYSEEGLAQLMVEQKKLKIEEVSNGTN